jgi:PAS domain S-box-containing protein
MVFSQAYTEMVNQANSRYNTEGQRPYPAPCLEIFLLNHAEQRAKRKEAALFGKLIDIFDWKLTRKQRQTYLKALDTGFTLVLTDLSKTILWVSRSFLNMTGYATTEAIGRTPAFLQGDATNPDELERVQRQLRREKSVEAELVNYRKGGDTYLCHVQIAPLHNGQGQLTHYLAIESAI